MFENVQNASIAVSSEEDLLAAMGEKPADSKDTKDKTSDKNKTDDSDGKSSKSPKKDKTATSSSKKSVSELSQKDLEIAAGETDDDDTEDDDKDDDDKDIKNENDTDDKVDDEDDDKDDKDDDKDDDKTDKDDEGEISVKDFLKARVNLLIKKGEWLDFEGRDDVEWDEDTFAEIELKQREAQRENLREELLDSFGPYGREIASYAANGGDPEDLIDIFKEQQRVGNLSIDDEDSQKEVVLKYATEYQEMSPTRARKYIDGLIADKELEDAAKEAKEKMEASLKAQQKELQEEQAESVKETQRKIKADQEKFAKDVNTVLNLRDDIPADEKRELLKVLTKFDKKLKNGATVNDFYFKFAEFRKDLPNYLELVRLVMDPKKYLKTVKNKGKSEATEKDFSLIRVANKTKKAKSSSIDENKTEKKSTFKLLNNY